MKFNCEYYIGTGPCAPMCTNPLYETGSGIANAYCDTCRYRMERLEAENAKLRELLAEDNDELAKMRRVIDYLYSFAKTRGVDADDMHELGIEVDE